MIGDQAIAGLTVEALQAMNALTIGRFLYHKTKIDGNTLIAHRGTTRILSAAIGTTKLGTNTDGTRIEFGGDGNLGNALSIAMEIGYTTGMQMTKALMPENAKLIASKVTDDILGVVDGRVEQLSKGWADRQRRLW